MCWKNIPIPDECNTILCYFELNGPHATATISHAFACGHDFTSFFNLLSKFRSTYFSFSLFLYFYFYFASHVQVTRKLSDLSSRWEDGEGEGESGKERRRWKNARTHNKTFRFSLWIIIKFNIQHYVPYDHLKDNKDNHDTSKCLSCLIFLIFRYMQLTSSSFTKQMQQCTHFAIIFYFIFVDTLLCLFFWSFRSDPIRSDPILSNWIHPSTYTFIRQLCTHITMKYVIERSIFIDVHAHGNALCTRHYSFNIRMLRFEN